MYKYIRGDKNKNETIKYLFEKYSWEQKLFKFKKKNNTFSFLWNLARLSEVACVLFKEFRLYETCFFDLSIKKSQYFPVRFMHYLDKNKRVQNHKDNSYSNKCTKFYLKKIRVWKRLN